MVQDEVAVGAVLRIVGARRLGTTDEYSGAGAYRITNGGNVTNYQVVSRTVSVYGLHAVHLISSEALDVGEMAEKFVGEGAVGYNGHLETWYAYEEDSLRLFHLRLWWREVRDGRPVRYGPPSLLEKFANGGA